MCSRKLLYFNVDWRVLINTLSRLQWTFSRSLSKLLQHSSDAWLWLHQPSPAFHVSVTHTHMVSAAISPLWHNLTYAESKFKYRPLFWRISAKWRPNEISFSSHSALFLSGLGCNSQQRNKQRLTDSYRIQSAWEEFALFHNLPMVVKQHCDQGTEMLTQCLPILEC